MCHTLLRWIAPPPLQIFFFPVLRFGSQYWRAPSTYQRVEGVLRAEGKLLHLAGVRLVCANPVGVNQMARNPARSFDLPAHAK